MSIASFHNRLRDRRRIEAFQSLIQSVVGPGRTVVEVGTGLGTYALFAAQAGARRVWAIEAGSVARVAEQVVRLNDFDHRVTVVRGRAPDVPLPERADVLIFDGFPTRLIDRATTQLLQGCVERYLRPGGRVLPGWARLCLAPVHAPHAWAASFPLGPEPFEAYGIDWTPASGFAEHQPVSVSLDGDCLVAPPVVLSETLLHPAPEGSRLGGSATWHTRPGWVHGLAYWFDLWTGPAGWLSNAPGDQGFWGQVFLPFRTPLEVGAGVPLAAQVDVAEHFSWKVRMGDAVREGHERADHPAEAGEYPRADVDRLSADPQGRSVAPAARPRPWMGSGDDSIQPGATGH